MKKLYWSLCKNPNFDGYHEGSPLVAFDFMPAVMSLFEQVSNKPFEFSENGKSGTGGKYSQENVTEV